MRATWRHRAMAAATVVMLASMTSFTPSALYPVYEREWGLRPWLLGLVFAAYPFAVMLSLLLLGSLADHVGRVRVLRGATALLGLALLVLAFSPTPGMLIAGRLLSGVAAALITGAGGALLQESHPGGIQAGSAWNGLAVSMGCGVAPYLASVIAAGIPWPTVMPYFGVLALLVPAAIILVRLPNDVPPPTARRRLRPVRVPWSIRAPFSLAAACILLTNLSMAAFGSFGSRLAGPIGLPEGHSGELIASVFLTMAIAQHLARHVPNLTAIGWGGVVLAAGWAVLAAVGAVSVSTAVALLAPVLIGIGAGLLLIGSMALVGEIAPAGQRAEVYSAYLVCAFATLGGSALLLGRTYEALSAGTPVVILAAVSLAGSVILIVASRRLARRAREAERAAAR